MSILFPAQTQWSEACMQGSAGSGIGKATAGLFAKEGAKVVVSDINEANGISTVDDIIKNGGEAFFIKADTSQPKDNEAMVKHTIQKYGGPVDGWQKVIDINLSGVFYGLRYQIPAMLKKGGTIVNIASILGSAATKSSPAYVASKHGVVGLTKAAALEYADKNIRINAVGPGYIKTPLVLESLDKPALDALVGLHPLGRLGEAGEIAETILWHNSFRLIFSHLLSGRDYKWKAKNQWM